MNKPAISEKQIAKLKKLYLDEGKCMLDVAKFFGVSTDAIVYAMRKFGIPRRSFKEASKRSFENKKMTFSRRELNSLEKVRAQTILTMLYWSEGFKGNENSKLTTFDFANSDSDMIRVFMKAFRTVYKFDEKKLRVHIYCYSNQNIPTLISYWSKLTGIPKSQFTKPYIREDSRINARIMKYGLIHIRYHDKKLLKDIKNMIDCVCC